VVREQLRTQIGRIERISFGSQGLLSLT